MLSNSYMGCTKAILPILDLNHPSQRPRKHPHTSVHVRSSFLHLHLLFVQPVLQLQLALSRMLSIAGEQDSHLTFKSPLSLTCQPWLQKSGASIVGFMHRRQM